LALNMVEDRADKPAKEYDRGHVVHAHAHKGGLAGSAELHTVMFLELAGLLFGVQQLASHY
jgi:hypothetical protein